MNLKNNSEYILPKEIDLSNCEKEPIHLLGKLQSNGHLLTVNTHSDIVFVSEGIGNLFGLLDTDLLNMTLNELVPEIHQDISSFYSYGQHYSPYYKLVEIGEAHYQLFFSKSGELVSIEFERTEGIYEYQEELSKNQDFVISLMSILSNCTDIDDLSNSCVTQIKSYTGFDRVMMYRFEDNGDGEIIAEDKSKGLESFLGLRYPASDIPPQARKLYITNKIRSINSIDDNGKAILSLDGDAEMKLDLSFSTFRSVSPIHIQYLKNMHVSATHAISVVIEEKLWGIIICHHYSGPKLLPIIKRLNTQVVGDIFANRLGLINTKKGLERSKQLSELINDIKYESQEIKGLLNTFRERIKTYFSAHALYYYSQYVSAEGDDEYDAFCKSINSKLSGDSQIEYSSNITEDLGIKNIYDIDGFLRIELDSSLGIYIFLFRKGLNKTINWAGNPNKPVEIAEDGSMALSPRNSFAKWAQKVEGIAEEWKDFEIQGARLIRAAILSNEIDNLRKGLDYKEAESRLQNLLQKRAEELERSNQLLDKELRKQKKYSKELEAAKLSLVHLNRVKTEFLSSLSHEMRTPLNGIMGIAHVLKENHSDEEVEHFTSLQLKSAERMLLSINRILELAQIEANQYTSHLEWTDIRDLIESTLDTILVLAEQKNQKINLIIHQKDNLLFTDSFLVAQIFINILSNSIKYTPDGGRIEINLKKIVTENRNLYRISIEDNGIGIDEENKNKVFESFFMENEASRQKDNSSGLGLYLVKNYAHYLDADVSIESEKGKGTLFTIDIPINNLGDEK